MNKRIALAVATMGLLLVAACGSSDPTPSNHPEEAYFDALKAGLDPLAERLQRLETSLGPLFPRSAPQELQVKATLGELSELEMLDMISQQLEALSAIEPPEAFRGDHEILLASTREQQATAVGFEEAIEREEFSMVHLRGAELREASIAVTAETSYAFCKALAGITLDPGAVMVCGDGEPVPGGEYGAAVDSIAKRFIVVFGPRASFPPGMAGEDLAVALEYVQPRIEELFVETLDRLNALDPPEGYAEGHQVAIDFFQGLLDTAYAIDVAVAERDFDQLQLEFKRSGEVADTASEALPDEYRPILRAIFPLEVEE